MGVRRRKRSRAPEGRRHRPEKWIAHQGGPGNPGAGRKARGGTRALDKGKGKGMAKSKGKDMAKGIANGKLKIKDQQCWKEIKFKMHCSRVHASRVPNRKAILQHAQNPKPKFSNKLFKACYIWSLRLWPSDADFQSKA